MLGFTLFNPTYKKDLSVNQILNSVGGDRFSIDEVQNSVDTEIASWLGFPSVKSMRYAGANAGKFLPYRGGRDGVFITPKTHPAQIHCSLLAPGQSLTFFLDAKLYWYDDKLILGGSDGLGGVWYFEDIKPGSYKVSFSYGNQRSVGVCFEPGRQPQVVEGL